MKTRIPLTICVLLFIGAIFCAHAANFAQDANLTAPQLMEFIVSDYSGLGDRYNACREDGNHLLVRIDDLPRIGDIDARILEMLTLIEDIRIWQLNVRQVDTSRNSAMDNIVLLRRSAGATAADLNKVMQYEHDMQEWSGSIDKLQVALGKQFDRIVKTLAALPPPDYFVSQSGIRFVFALVKRGRGIYVSEKPISREQYESVMKAVGHPVSGSGSAEGNWTGMTYAEALSFIADLSSMERHEFTLLTSKQLKILEGSECVKQPEIASWLGNPVTVDFRESRQMKLFGINLVEVWDPSGALRKDVGTAVVNELPGAHYDVLGCYVTTSDLNGKQIYFEQLKRKK